LSDITRTIGLSLGADICWPLCYEHLMKRLDLKLPAPDGGTMRFHVERVYIEPFDLRRDCKYDVVIDRLTHWYHTSREWIKKAIILNGLYVFNNPWSLQSMEKHTSYCAMIRLGMPIPETWLVPPKDYDHKKNPDTKPTLSRYAKLFDLGRLGQKVGYPAFVKPYDGGGWRSVVKCDDEQALKDAYEKSGMDVMHVQAGVMPHDRFVRTIGFGPQTHHVLYDPVAPLHDRYTMQQNYISQAEEEHLRKITLTINSFFGWEFNSCESLRATNTGVWHPIDFANPCPDSQVTSLHWHFPWLVKAYVRWSVFCAATRRRMRQTLDWEPFFEIADSERSFAEKLDAYTKIAEERMHSERFEEFCAKHLAHLDEVAWEFFATNEAREAVRQKVVALFPAHEVEQFTELFWSRIQKWRADEKPL
jgi:hypothetical protein